MYRIRNLINANGNMTRDRNKDIYSISYNVLNLPACIEYYDGREVRYTYAADGRKLHVDYVLNPFAIADEGGEGEAPAPDPEGPEGLNIMIHAYITGVAPAAPPPAYYLAPLTGLAACVSDGMDDTDIPKQR